MLIILIRTELRKHYIYCCPTLLIIEHMKTNTLKTINMVVALIAGISTTATTQARTLKGKLEVSANAMASWRITCSSNFPKFRITDLPEPSISTNGFVYALLAKQGSHLTRTKFDSDGGTSSSWGELNLGSGNYTLHVYKEHIGSENFSVEILCGTLEPITDLVSTWQATIPSP